MAYASDLQGIKDLLAAYDLGASSIPGDAATTRLQAQATARVNGILQGVGVDINGLDAVTTALAEVLENLMTARQVVRSGSFTGRDVLLRGLEIDVRNETARLRKAAEVSLSTRLGRKAGFRVGQITTRADRVRPKTLTG